MLNFPLTKAFIVSKYIYLPITNKKFELHEELSYFPIFFDVFNSPTSSFDEGVGGTPHSSHQNEPACWHVQSHNCYLWRKRGPWVTLLTWESVPINKHICKRLWLNHKVKWFWRRFWNFVNVFLQFRYYLP